MRDAPAVRAPVPGPEAEPPRRRGLIGLDRAELGAVVGSLGEPERAWRMRERQLWHWLYHRGARSFREMSNVSKALRARLEEACEMARPAVVSEQRSLDGTLKWLLRLADGNEVECVYIPEEERGTLCVSTQVGCTLSCRFCYTGTQRLVRNLEPGEIVGQVMVARDALGEWPTPSGTRLISNLVVMGMGEPLYNYQNVAKALGIVMDGDGIALSRRRITLSTAGVVPMMARCGSELGVNLAVSLHAVNDELRDRLVPLNRKYPIAELLAACRAYPAGSNARRITFEYVMLRGVNDSPAEARELTRLIAGIPAKVNLIPFNPWPGAPFECSDDDAIRAFATIVNNAGYAAPVRSPRGQDVMAACGQLRSASLRKPKRGAAKRGAAPAEPA
ncbi:MAG: 23S rRNA (adenine(2503)-C(2))-methyltransferase RlmN [Alphaproteobacteria bacterium]|nr:23S rRNA (adenine(2503)-C(2))-methyltransferase RlmN [Alphaproteobacteria bacterium]